MKKIAFILVTAFTLFMQTACCTRLEKDKAEAIAKKRLIEYCERKGLSLISFSPPQLEEQKKGRWMISYKATGNRHLEVIVLIDCKGNSEVSFSEQE